MHALTESNERLQKLVDGNPNDPAALLHHAPYHLPWSYACAGFLVRTMQACGGLAAHARCRKPTGGVSVAVHTSAAYKGCVTGV
jgi:hypothetical protein